MPYKIPMKSERGQTMTEFALVLPLLILLLFGVVQFGIAFNNYLMLTDAVRAGARKGTVARHMADPVGAVEEQVRAAGTDLDPDDLDIAVTSTWEQGEDVTVSASYPYSVSLLGLVVKSGELSSTTTMSVER
jgi:Flp pilus assembly protein TadG